ncbi:MAG: NADH-quinone oxidoreductase subunit N [Phycisphaerae bacterium]|nr:NADH-quinone oxidoreductase subunit N [Phycisphaerae bacterium]
MNHYAVNLVLALLPEIALLAGGMLIVLLLATQSTAEGDCATTHRRAAWAALFTVFAAAMLLQLGPRVSPDELRPPAPQSHLLAASQPAGVVMLGPPVLALDGTTRAVRWAAIFMGVLLIGGNFGCPENVTSRLKMAGRGSPEFFMLLLFSLAGLMLVASANDLIVLFLAIELTSLPTVVAVVLSRPRHGAIEAGGKYFFLSALSVAFLLLGLAYVYGATGTTSLERITSMTAYGWAGAKGPIGLVAVSLVVAGLAFNIAAFPYHVYLADVYQGAAAPVSGWLAFVAKAAGFVALAKVLVAVAGPVRMFDLGWVGEPVWQRFIAGLAVATMLASNVLALRQRSVKRMLAYSSVAHSGYILVALLVVPEPGETLPIVAMFYLVGYGLANLGAFLTLSAANPDDSREADTFDDLRGLARRKMPLAVAMAIFGFSLMGLPITVGFMGKVFVFVGAYRAGFAWLVVVALINSAIGVAYYLRMVASCWLDVLDPASDDPSPVGRGSQGETAAPPRPTPSLVIAVLAVLTVGFGLLPAGLFRPMASERTVREILHPAPPPAPPRRPPLASAPARP